LAVIDENAKRALAALDFVDGSFHPKKEEEWAEILYQLTNIIRLLEITDRVTSGWGRYVLDNTVKRLGTDAEEKIRVKRAEALSYVSSLDKQRLEKISPSLRRELLEQRIFDYEPPLRQLFNKMFLNLLATRDLRVARLGTYSPRPISILYSKDNMILVSLDNIYIDPQTVRIFESKDDARVFLLTLTTALLYTKRKGMYSAEEVLKDRIATDLSRSLYKLLLKSMKEESKRNMNVVEMFRDGELYRASESLMKNEGFYITMKNMTPPVLLEFENGRVYATSFLASGIFDFDEYAKRRISESIADGTHVGFLYLSSTLSLFDFITRNFSDDSVYLKTNFAPSSLQKAAWSNKLPLQIFAECTADYERASAGGRVVSSFVGIKRIAIIFSSDEAIELVKPDEDFRTDPVHNSLIYSTATMLNAENGTMQQNFYAMPEVDIALSEIRKVGKIERKTIKKINAVFRGIRTLDPFSYIEREGRPILLGSFTEKIAIRSRRG